MIDLNFNAVFFSVTQYLFCSMFADWRQNFLMFVGFRIEIIHLKV